MLAAVLLGALCALVVNTLPVFLTVLARAFALSEQEVGYVALADMGGIAIGTISCALSPQIVSRLGWRKVAFAGIAVFIFGNLLTSQVTSFAPLLLSRAVTGMGGGMTMAIAYAVIADGLDSARDLAVFNVFQLGSGAIGVRLLGPIAGALGPQGLFQIIGGLAICAIPLCFVLPPKHSSSKIETGGQDHAAKVSPVGWLSIISAFLYFGGAGAVYGFLAFMGVAWGGDAQSVEAGLSLVLAAGMTGGIVSAVIGSRFDFDRPLYLGYAVFLFSIILLIAFKPVDNFTLFAALFGFGWNILTPFQFAAVTHVDGSSSAAMLVNASTLGGIALGPAVAGNFVTANYDIVNIGALSACIVSLLLLIFALRQYRTTQIAIRAITEGQALDV